MRALRSCGDGVRTSGDGITELWCRLTHRLVCIGRECDQLFVEDSLSPRSQSQLLSQVQQIDAPNFHRFPVPCWASKTRRDRRHRLSWRASPRSSTWVAVDPLPLVLQKVVEEVHSSPSGVMSEERRATYGEIERVVRESLVVVWKVCVALSNHLSTDATSRRSGTMMAAARAPELLVRGCNGSAASRVWFRSSKRIAGSYASESELTHDIKAREQ